jgi:ATP-dependent Lhr-like helicase
MRFALAWQHLAAQRQLTGEAGLLEVLRGLEGFEAPAVEWERSLLPQRVAGYDPRWLDALCMAGVVGWGRVSPHPCFDSVETGGSKSSARRVVPTSMAPVTFFIREEALWMDLCLQQRQIDPGVLKACLSELAGRLRSFLGERGAMFSGDLARSFAVPVADLQRALWELVAAGLVTADGFDSLRILIDPKRNGGHKPRGKVGHAAGRWALLCGGAMAATPAQREAQLESACVVLLRRYGVVFRDLLAREETMPRWRELLGIFRRMEARGEVRGGRFLSGFGGEQFALPEAVESLREMRRRPDSGDEITVAAADPMNLAGIVVPGERVAAVPGKTVLFINGVVGGVAGGVTADGAVLPTRAAATPNVLDEMGLPGLYPALTDLLRQSRTERADA